MKLRHPVLVASLSILVALSAPAHSVAAGSVQRDRITVIGDSILTAVEWNPQPLSILEQGLPAIELQIAVCRTLVGPGCPFEGERPPNLVDVVEALGDEIGSTVVVEVGYNDPEDGFGTAVDDSVRALLAVGVQRILWVNFHDWVPQYAQLNTDLAQVVARYPEVSIVDWRDYSLNRYSWFQSDGVHLVLSGAVALATLINQSLVAALTPPLVAHAPAVTVARVGCKYTAHLGVTGGKAPFRWRVTGRRLGRGLHLLANGVLTGTPTKAGRIRIHLQVSDSSGESGELRLVLTIGPRSSTA
ncbi:MAG TPA: putative Ig domain-containing protein [Gaiellaceae bacterium]